MIEYSDESMFWLVNRLAQFAYLRYNHIGKELRMIIDKHENEKISEIQKIDEAAMELLKKQGKSKIATAAQYLTGYSVSSADSLFRKWKSTDRYLLVKYIDGNTKKQNEDGSFKNTRLS